MVAASWDALSAVVVEATLLEELTDPTVMAVSTGSDGLPLVPPAVELVLEPVSADAATPAERPFAPVDVAAGVAAEATVAALAVAIDAGVATLIAAAGVESAVEFVDVPAVEPPPLAAPLEAPPPALVEVAEFEALLAPPLVPVPVEVEPVDADPVLPVPVDAPLAPLAPEAPDDDDDEPLPPVPDVLALVPA
jgi:hypothetical protein